MRRTSPLAITKAQQCRSDVFGALEPKMPGLFLVFIRDACPEVGWSRQSGGVLACIVQYALRGIGVPRRDEMTG